MKKNLIILEAPFELTNRIRTLRKDNDGVKSDIHERNLEYLKKVYESALFVAEYLSWDIIKCNIGDELKSIDDIHEEIYQLVKKNIWLLIKQKVWFFFFFYRLFKSFIL